MARDLASGVGRKAGENASVVPDEASVDLANPGPDANAGIPLTVRLAFGAPNGSIALCQCLLNVDQLTSSHWPDLLSGATSGHRPIGRLTPELSWAAAS